MGAVKVEKFPHTREPLHWQGRGCLGEKLQSHKGECSNRGAKGKVERFLHKKIGADQHSPAWEACLLTCWGGWGPGAEAQALEVRLQGEDWGWLCKDSLKWASTPQPAGTKSRKKSGPAGEARNLCFAVRKETGFLPRVSTEGRAPPKRAPGMGVSRGYQLRPQRITLLPLPLRSLCASTGHYPHTPPRSLCCMPLPRSHDPGTSSLGEHMVHLRLL